jgi:zinc transport system substrate-binding protein
MHRQALALFATCLLGTAFSAPVLAAPKVITSVVPVYGIVSAVMGDIGQPELLLKGSSSEHRATFSPQQVAELGRADVVFIIGHGLEAKLAQMSGSEAVNGKAFVELSEAAGVATLPIREGGTWEAHDHEEGHDHDHEAEHADEQAGVLSFDPHVWLDPANAKAMAAAAVAELSKADPSNAGVYEANGKAFAASLDALSGEITAELAPVKDKPFIVFHDAYQYFERRFGLAGAGSISDVSAQSPSAQRLEEIRNRLKETKAACVFREPQYDGKVVATVVEGTDASEGVLDPLGATLEPGPGVYQQILLGLAKNLKSCLGA